MASESLVIEVNETPHSAAASRDGAHVYVTQFRTGTVSVLDAVGNSIEKSLKVQSDPDPYGVATHPAAASMSPTTVATSSGGSIPPPTTSDPMPESTSALTGWP
jgi:YVTN family beta-propeller protein